MSPYIEGNNHIDCNSFYSLGCSLNYTKFSENLKIGPLIIGDKAWWKVQKIKPICMDKISKKFPDMFELHQAWDQKVRFCLDWSSGLQKTQICLDWPIRPQKQSISLRLPQNGTQITKWNYIVMNVVTQCPYCQHYPLCMTGYSLSTQFWSRGLSGVSRSIGFWVVIVLSKDWVYVLVKKGE